MWQLYRISGGSRKIPEEKELKLLSEMNSRPVKESAKHCTQTCPSQFPGGLTSLEIIKRVHVETMCRHLQEHGGMEGVEL